MWLNSGRMKNTGLILASASERRRRILEELGVRFVVEVPPDEEEMHALPEVVVRANARRKLEWCRRAFPRRRILAADTVVVFKRQPLGKPADMDEARRWLREFSGATQDVLTGVAFLDGRGTVREDVVSSVVVFRNLTGAAIAEYLEKVDPLDKAGGYDIDQHGDLIIERWEGSRTNIMGLPAELVAAWFREDGVL